MAFVERNATALACIRRNLETLGVPPSDYVVVPADVGAFLAAPAAFLPGGDFAATFAASTDVIFADPPYDTPWYDEAVAKLEASGLCAQEGLAVIEMAQGRELHGVMGSPWELSDERKYGKTRVELWRRGIHAGETE